MEGDAAGSEREEEISNRWERPERSLLERREFKGYFLETIFYCVDETFYIKANQFSHSTHSQFHVFIPESTRAALHDSHFKISLIRLILLKLKMCF